MNDGIHSACVGGINNKSQDNVLLLYSCSSTVKEKDAHLNFYLLGIFCLYFLKEICFPWLSLSR